MRLGEIRGTCERADVLRQIFGQRIRLVESSADLVLDLQQMSEFQRDLMFALRHNRKKFGEMVQAMLLELPKLPADVVVETRE